MKFKVLTSAALVAALFSGYATVQTSAAAAPAVKVTVDAKAVSFPDAKPYTESSRVLIPVRFVSQALGGSVDYKNKTVSIKQNDGKTVSMKVNGTKVSVGGKTVTLDVPVRVKQNRTYVPLRFVSEALRATVDWNQAQRLVSITTESGAATPVPTVPDADNAFDWKPGYTDLAKALFKGNVQAANGKLSLTIPGDARAEYFDFEKSKRIKLDPGNSYSYSIGKGKGFISITKIYPGREELEGYSIFLDAEAEGGKSGEVIVSGNNGKGTVRGTLSEVINKANLF
ncbi:copper amine oxidase N-terminal domain-containing protein [Paenibacillus polymyxa]|uniref:copper amine oxidase N-terminal domain-containing protein n=1 Tax=Paenibacillus polymyxa TaxID=1406 RepID=UPI0025B69681|nr:copper amine oxidase N-terminal domain-containing protein [Paenibacillus polymyxa]MDN4090919.1 copper amine oxidase N-terminal domain-containing protein [Paenibacillus polymyxa]